MTQDANSELVVAAKELSALKNSALRSYGDLLDYFWKSPNFIDAELKIEAMKLREYFPASDDPEKHARNMEMREYRWALEGPKHLSVFPRLLASSDFLISFAIYETFLLQVVNIVDGVAEKKFCSTKGVGFSKFIEYFLQFKISIVNLEFGSQIFNASKIRNCIIHSFGIMSLSDKNLDIINIIKEKLYLRDDWNEEPLPARVDPTITISGKRGDLIVGMGYPYHFAALAQGNLFDLLDSLIVELCK